MNYFVYILKCSDGTFYVGKTKDLQKRLKAHNGAAVGGAKYTRGRRPVVLVYYEEKGSVTEALQREYQLKKLVRSEKERLVKSFSF